MVTRGDNHRIGDVQYRDGALVLPLSLIDPPMPWFSTGSPVRPSHAVIASVATIVIGSGPLIADTGVSIHVCYDLRPTASRDSQGRNRASSQGARRCGKAQVRPPPKVTELPIPLADPRSWIPYLGRSRVSSISMPEWRFGIRISLGR
jgi:hypothetical protein